MLGEVIIERFTHAGLRVHVGYDADVHPDTNPRSEPSARIGVMVMRDMGSGYADFADETWDDREETCEACGGDGEIGVHDTPCERCDTYGTVTIDPLEYARRQGARVALGLYFRAHGPQCTVGTNEVNIIGDADMGNADGVIFDTPNDVRANGWHRAGEQPIIAALKSEVECMGWYLDGSVYAYELLDANGEVVDSCYGFLDKDEDYCTQEARAAAEAHVRREKGMTNEERADYGRKAIEVGTIDFGRNGQDDEGTITDAADTVANVLHRVAREVDGDPEEAIALVLERANRNFADEFGEE